jgi:hypothetical protein
MIVCNDALRFVSFMVLSPDLRFTNVPRLNSLAHHRSCLWRAGKCRLDPLPQPIEAGFIHPLKRRFEPQSTLVAQTFLAKVRNGPPICFRIRCCDLLRPPRCTGAFIGRFSGRFHGKHSYRIGQGLRSRPTEARGAHACRSCNRTDCKRSGGDTTTSVLRRRLRLVTFLQNSVALLVLLSYRFWDLATLPNKSFVS